MGYDIHPRFLVLAGTIIVFVTTHTGAGTRDYAVEVSATVQESPPQVDFSWRAEATATEYRIYRKSIDDTLWTGPSVSITASLE